MKRHNTDRYHVVGEGILTHGPKSKPTCVRPSSREELTAFRFSRMGPKGTGIGETARIALGTAMTTGTGQTDDPAVPAGYTYLAQFVDHDLTMDATKIGFGDQVTVEQLVQGRSPALDLDSLYGFGPDVSPEFYSDGLRLKVGTTAAAGPDAQSQQEHVGADLPRVGGNAPRRRDQRQALIPDVRNDENLAVAQTHAMFIRFHNRVVDRLAATTPSVDLFRRARETVTLHYQWMLRHDMLPRLVDPAVVTDVFENGRRFFEVPPAYDGTYLSANSYMCAKDGDAPTMPVEFSVAAYRLGHSMIRGAYQWNKVFRTGGPLGGTTGTLPLLFTFSGTSGTLSPDGTPADPDSGSFLRLPSNWIADFRRLYDFSEATHLTAAERAALAPPAGGGNVIRRIDTLLVDPLADLPPGSFGGRDQAPPPVGPELNLAVRNLTRAEMVELASGTQMAQVLGITPLTPAEILTGAGGVDLGALDQTTRDAIVEHPPLWFYVLREAELNGGRLAGVGARIVAEVFHRAIEGSRISMLADRTWRPDLGPDADTFRMIDLILAACDGRPDLVNPLGD